MYNRIKLSPKAIEWDEIESISKPALVYKYRSWNKSAFHDNLLLKNELYLSAPVDFEDQYDCKNPTRYDLLTEPETKMWIEKTFRRLHPRYDDQTVQRHVEFYFSRNGFKDEAYLKRNQKSEWEAYNKQAGVLSLTVNPLNESLWRKYGDNYAGLAFGFDTNKLIRSTQIPRGGIVQYTDELPIIHPFDEIMEQVFIRIYFKITYWSFEQEFRLSDFGMRPRLRHFSDDSLVEVIIGPEFDPSQIPVIKKHLTAKGDHIKIYQVKQINGLLKKLILA